jgi:hypothetical protein
VAQGAVLSPILYDLFINPLAEELEASGLGFALGDGTRIPALLYADDIVLLAESPEDLQRMLDIVSAYADKWQFQFNLPKSALVMFGPTPLHRPPARPFTLSGQLLQTALEYRYLGVVFRNPSRAPTQRWAGVLAEFEQSIVTRSRALLSWCSAKFHSGLAPVTIMRLWKALVRPLYESACEVWHPFITKGQQSALEKLMIRFARAALRASPCLADAFIRGELGVTTIASHQNELALRLFGRLCAMRHTRLAGRVFRTQLTAAQACSDPTGPRSGVARSWVTAVRKIFQRYDMARRRPPAGVGPHLPKGGQSTRAATVAYLHQRQVLTAAVLPDERPHLP